MKININSKFFISQDVIDITIRQAEEALQSVDEISLLYVYGKISMLWIICIDKELEIKLETINIEISTLLEECQGFQ